MEKTIYYLPGYGGQLGTGLGGGLLSRGFSVSGRETIGEFKDLPFVQQVQTVVDDLESHFWSEDAYVVANSFGGYLFLHAQSQMKSYPGSVLVLSPIVGEFSNEETGMNFLPPYASRLRECVESGLFNRPRRCEIHVGELDWQSQPENVLAFSRQTNIPAVVVPGAGHMLGKEYVGPVLDRWLGTEEAHARKT